MKDGKRRAGFWVNLHIEFEAADNLTKFGNSYNYMNNAAASNKIVGLLCLFNGFTTNGCELKFVFGFLIGF